MKAGFSNQLDVAVAETNGLEPGRAPGPTIGPARGAATENELAGYEDDDAYPETFSVPGSPYSNERSALHALTQTSFMASLIPPSPPGSPDPGANAKFKRFLELKSKGVHFNEDLAGKSSFQNPSLFASMLARAGITEQEQYSTTLPKELWSVEIFPEWAYKEGLLQQQRDINKKIEAEKKAQSAAGKRTIEFIGAQSGSSSRASTPSSTILGNAHDSNTQSKRKRP